MSIPGRVTPLPPFDTHLRNDNGTGGVVAHNLDSTRQTTHDFNHASTWVPCTPSKIVFEKHASLVDTLAKQYLLFYRNHEYIINSRRVRFEESEEHVRKSCLCVAVVRQHNQPPEEPSCPTPTLLGPASSTLWHHCLQLFSPAELGQWQSNETIHLSSKMAALVRQTIYLNVKANNLLRYQGRGVGSVAKNLPYTLSDQRLTLCLNPSLEVSVKLLVKFISIKILLTPFVYKPLLYTSSSQLITLIITHRKYRSILAIQFCINIKYRMVYI